MSIFSSIRSMFSSAPAQPAQVQIPLSSLLSALVPLLTRPEVVSSGQVPVGELIASLAALAQAPAPSVAPANQLGSLIPIVTALAPLMSSNPQAASGVSVLLSQALSPKSAG